MKQNTTRLACGKKCGAAIRGLVATPQESLAAKNPLAVAAPKLMLIIDLRLSCLFCMIASFLIGPRR
jgi:hypothetical protein